MRGRDVMRGRRTVAALLAVAVLLPGCGVPTSSQPVDRGTAPLAMAQARSVPNEPAGPDGASLAPELVRLYLQAAAWGNSKSADRPLAIDQAEARLRGFLTADGAARWSPGDRELKLVRVTLGDQHTGADGSVNIDATLQPVGVLDDFGSVRPATDTTPQHYLFRVVPVEGGKKRRLADAPPGFLMDVAALDSWYVRHTIYFWAADSDTVLVPDTRYMPTAVSPDKQPNEVWRWLAKGPSDLLTSAVDPLPDNVNLKDKIVTERQHGDAVLVVNLTSEAAGLQQLRNLMVQIRWSMRLNEVPVELRIEGVRKDIDGSSDQYLRANPAVWPADQTEPEKLAVVDHRAMPTERSGEPGATVLSAPENQNVITAALARVGEQQFTALVRQEAGNRQRLWLGRITTHGEAVTPRYQQTELVGTSMSRPVWLAGSTPRVLIARDGQLVSVSINGQVTTVTNLPGIPGPVTAVAAAPDGRRIALISGEQPGIATIRIDGDALSIRAYRPLASGLAKSTGIGWTREDTVLIGGRAVAGSPLVMLRVDGTGLTSVDRASLSGLTITRLVAYPDDPAKGGDRLLAMFEADNQSYNVFGQKVIPLQVAQVEPSASPSTPAGSSPHVPVVTAPFFHESL